MTADVNPCTLNLACVLVGTHQDLLGSYEAGRLLSRLDASVTGRQEREAATDRAGAQSGGTRGGEAVKGEIAERAADSRLNCQRASPRINCGFPADQAGKGPGIRP